MHSVHTYCIDTVHQHLQEEMVSVLEQCVEVIEGVRSLKDMYPHQLNESQGDVVRVRKASVVEG